MVCCPSSPLLHILWAAGFLHLIVLSVSSSILSAWRGSCLKLLGSLLSSLSGVCILICQQLSVQLLLVPSPFSFIELSPCISPLCMRTGILLIPALPSSPQTCSPTCILSSHSQERLFAVTSVYKNPCPSTSIQAAAPVSAPYESLLESLPLLPSFPDSMTLQWLISQPAAWTTSRTFSTLLLE